MSNIALLVVDVQNALINVHPHNEQRVIENIKKLILTARDNKKEVVYVRHDDGKGTELENGTYGWQIYDKISPNSNKLIFENSIIVLFIKLI